MQLCTEERGLVYSDLLSTASSSDFWDTFTLNRAKQSSPYALHSQMCYLLQSTGVRNISKKHTFIKLLLLFSKYATVRNNSRNEETWESICSQCTKSSVPKRLQQHSHTLWKQFPPSFPAELIWSCRMRTDMKTTTRDRLLRSRRKSALWFSQYSLPLALRNPSGTSATLRGHCKFYIWSCAEEGVPPPCKNIWTPLINRAQRNASPMVRADIKSKQLPRTYQLLCWFCPAQVMVLLFVNRRLAGQGAGRKCDLLHLVAENREYN